MNKKTPYFDVESFQTDMARIDVCFEKLGEVYDMLAEKIANLRLGFESSNVEHRTLNKSELR